MDLTWRETDRGKEGRRGMEGKMEWKSPKVEFDYEPKI